MSLENSRPIPEQSLNEYSQDYVSKPNINLLDFFGFSLEAEFSLLAIIYWHLPSVAVMAW